MTLMLQFLAQESKKIKIKNKNKKIKKEQGETTEKGEDDFCSDRYYALLYSTYKTTL